MLGAARGKESEEKVRNRDWTPGIGSGKGKDREWLSLSPSRNTQLTAFNY